MSEEAHGWISVGFMCVVRDLPAHHPVRRVVVLADRQLLVVNCLPVPGAQV